MKSNTIFVNLNYNEDDIQIDVEELIKSIKNLLKDKYKECNVAYQVIDSSLTNITIPSYPTNPNVPWYDPSPYRYDKTIDPPEWLKNVPQCMSIPNCPPYATPINMTINNKGYK